MNEQRRSKAKIIFKKMYFFLDFHKKKVYDTQMKIVNFFKLSFFIF